MYKLQLDLKDGITLPISIMSMHDQNGQTLLMAAAKIGCIELIRYIVKLINPSLLTYQFDVIDFGSQLSIDPEDRIKWRLYFSKRDGKDNNEMSAIQYAACRLSLIQPARNRNPIFKKQLECFNCLYFVEQVLNLPDPSLGCLRNNDDFDEAVDEGSMVGCSA
jgi:hypothetical protein